ncbi:hypothetical protein CBS101457_002266 [Exobasidium rhododendri]|nr:hypothetical protein CBS101457_002266 [Exobasidium rhododendri]
MPIHILSEALASVFALETYPVILASIFAIVFLKQWSSGVDLLAHLDRATSAPEREIDDDKGGTLVKKRGVKARDLHGTIVLVVGGFSSQGLLVCSQLSSLGAQLILLTPTLKSSRILQVIHLLRDGTSNPLIYAEECDISNLASVEAFAQKWNQGSGSSGEAARRIDTIIFMPLDSTQYSIGDRARKTEEGVESSHAEVLGRFQLINKLLPTLMLLPPHRDIRVISLVSPWYAAGLDAFDASDLNFERIQPNKKGSRFTPNSPWRIEGAQALLWLSLSRELQRRIQLMTDADVRPRTKLPGIDDQGHISTTKITNVNVINVSAGFERGRNVLDYLLPSQAQVKEDADWEEGHDEGKDSSPAKTSITPAEALRELVNPGSQRTTSEKKATLRGKAEEALNQQLMQSSPILGGLIRFAQWCTVSILWPLAWLLCKSPRRAAETVTWATVVPIFDGSQPLETTSPGLFAVAGELHREGRLLRPVLPESLLPGDASNRIWKAEEDQIRLALSSSS